MPTKKKITYKQCAVKGCRKKAIKGGRCKIHAQKNVDLSSPNKENTAEVKVPSNKSRNCLKQICYEAGLALRKINSLISKS